MNASWPSEAAVSASIAARRSGLDAERVQQDATTMSTAASLGRLAAQAVESLAGGSPAAAASLPARVAVSRSTRTMTVPAAHVAEPVRLEPRDEVVGRVVGRRRPDVRLADERGEQRRAARQATVEPVGIGRPADALRRGSRTAPGRSGRSSRTRRPGRGSRGPGSAWTRASWIEQAAHRRLVHAVQGRYGPRASGNDTGRADRQVAATNRRVAMAVMRWRRPAPARSHREEPT